MSPIHPDHPVDVLRGLHARLHPLVAFCNLVLELEDKHVETNQALDITPEFAESVIELEGDFYCAERDVKAWFAAFAPSTITREEAGEITGSQPEATT